MFLKNRNISSKIKRSKVTDYAALTVNIRHCLRMNNFLSEADLVSINIFCNQITNKHENNLRNTLELLILRCGILFT